MFNFIWKGLFQVAFLSIFFLFYLSAFLSPQDSQTSIFFFKILLSCTYTQHYNYCLFSKSKTLWHTLLSILPRENPSSQWGDHSVLMTLGSTECPLPSPPWHLSPPWDEKHRIFLKKKKTQNSDNAKPQFLVLARRAPMRRKTLVSSPQKAEPQNAFWELSTHNGCSSGTPAQPIPGRPSGCLGVTGPYP